MKSNSTLSIGVFLISILGFNGCNDPSPPGPPTSNPTNGTTLPALSGKNVVPLTVNGSLCSSNSYANKPCVNVTICAAGNTSNCQTISDILVDTGSYGLRIFKSAINSSVLAGLVPVVVGGNSLAECVQYGDGSSNWGPVESASVILGGEPPVQTPIQILDSTFANSSTYCSGADTSPDQAGFNGILGVGLFLQDCGAECANQAANNLYYSCSGSNCSAAAVPVSSQVQNPVAMLSQDNNGVILELPIIPPGGVPSVNGYLVLGIGTQANNSPGGVTTYSADAINGEFTTNYNGTSMISFLDSGSNGLYFVGPAATLPDCGSTDPNYAGFFCPASTLGLSATNTGSSGSPSLLTPFEVGNAMGLMSNVSNNVFLELAGTIGGTNQFDWGMPFYLGRNIYVGFESRSSGLGTGPYWAY